MSQNQCFLTLDAVNHGTLNCHYTSTPPAQYLAKAVCANPIPQHNFQGSGKAQVQTQCDTTKNFYGGWCTWLKNMKNYDATITINPDQEKLSGQSLVVFLHSPDNKVTRCDSQFALKGSDACAVCSAANQEFKSPSMTSQLFLEKARKTTSAGQPI